MGRPQNTKNKKTLERMRKSQQEESSSRRSSCEKVERKDFSPAANEAARRKSNDGTPLPVNLSSGMYFLTQAPRSKSIDETLLSHQIRSGSQILSNAQDETLSNQGSTSLYETSVDESFDPFSLAPDSSISFASFSFGNVGSPASTGGALTLGNEALQPTAVDPRWQSFDSVSTATSPTDSYALSPMQDFSMANDIMTTFPVVETPMTALSSPPDLHSASPFSSPSALQRSLSTSDYVQPSTSQTSIFAANSSVQARSPSYDPETRCSCLRDQAALFVQMKSLSNQRIRLSVDVALASISEAVLKWQNLLRCQSCRGGNDLLEILSLAAMSMGLATQVLQTQVYALQDPFNPAATDDEHIRQLQNDAGVDPLSGPGPMGVSSSVLNEARMLSATSLFRTIHRIISVLRQCYHEAQRLEQRFNFSQNAQSVFHVPCLMGGVAGIRESMGMKSVEIAETSRIEELRQARHVQSTMRRLEQDLRSLLNKTAEFESNFMSG
ncbi:MAG: hypothetical protein M1822_001571 [Bathelium mastoideum]|nr:MAG: hypothetical protein M1822_001571 [Bathelium mastoideum]